MPHELAPGPIQIVRPNSGEVANPQCMALVLGLVINKWPNNYKSIDDNIVLTSNIIICLRIVSIKIKTINYLKI
jgi:hypothetical protein